FQLAFGYRDRLFSGGASLRLIAWGCAAEALENLWTNAAQNAFRGSGNPLYARTRICDALFGNGCGTGIGIHPNGRFVSLLRHIARLAWCSAYWQRYLIKCLIRGIATHHGGTTQTRFDFDVCSE